MIRLYVAVAFLGFVVCPLYAENERLQEQFKLVVGDIQQTPPAPTVKESAREYIIGRQFAIQDQHRKAIAHFRQAINFDDLSPAPWVGLAISLGAIGRTDSAIVAWNEAILRDSSHKDATLIVGIDAAKCGQVEKGKKLLAQHWLKEDALPLEELLRTAALLSVFKNDKNISSLLQNTIDPIIETAIQDLVSDASSPAWLGMLQQLVDLDSVDLALQLSKKAASKLQQKELGAILTALPVLEAASGGDGSITQDTYEQISLHQDIPLAPRWFEPVSLAEALSIAAQSMSIVSKDIRGPIRLYTASLALDKTDALTINNLAWVTLQRDGPTQNVQQLCAKAMELDPSASHILDTVGWMYVLLGKSELGIPLFVEALQSMSQPSAEIYNHLGDAYWLVGQKENAVRAWRTSSMLLHSMEYRQGMLEGFASMTRTVWGIVVATPEALYDFELGDITRRLEDKLTAIQEEREPLLQFAVPKNGVN